MASSEFPNGFAPFTAEHPPVRGQAAANGAPASAAGGILEVEVHQARNLHNICIYAKQDVYAKLSLNDAAGGSGPTAFYTEVVDKGGKDPVFNQKFCTSLVQSDRALRCEVWMASKMRDYLQDQLLGAVTIPLSTLVGKDKEFNEFELSSTELFHSPAGSITMSLKFEEITKLGDKASPEESNDCEVTVCNSTTSNLSASSLDGIDSKVVAFADLADAREDEELVSDFIQRKQNVEAAAKDDGIYTGPPFLKLDCAAVRKSLAADEARSEDEVPELDDEQSVVEQGTDKLFSAPAASGGEKENISKPGLKQLDVPASPSLLESSVSNGVTPTPSSKPKEDLSISKADEEKHGRAAELGGGGEGGVMSDEEAAKFGFVSKPVIQPEPRIMQQEIMDMYTRSMQQFSDALAKMQLPVDENGLIKLDEAASSETTNSKDTKNTNDNNNSSSGSERSGESSGGGKRNLTSSNTPRVFYGSRAFF
ncbi:uncharacterized protein LOC9655793 [Selaginella moellendorffii]|nr:uncharacterized protein LOC9655793 [Selaginella moellendorffii]|eukprot:XP_002960857.2 uncharacterized protein LOC9655793 [Selaginella moellendorffii]